MALIVDEYGALRGVVTQTDLLEALAGEIVDDGELDVLKREDGSFLVDATMAIHDAFDQLGIARVPDDHSEYRTMAGFILRRLGHVPIEGEQFEWDTDGDVRRFEVVDLDGHRIDKVMVSAAKTLPVAGAPRATMPPFPCREPATSGRVTPANPTFACSDGALRA